MSKDHAQIEIRGAVIGGYTDKGVVVILRENGATDDEIIAALSEAGWSANRTLNAMTKPTDNRPAKPE